MSSPHEATLPASRLRLGDILPAHGPQATICQPPVVSVDGSMVTVVVTRGPDDTGLLRVPVDQPVQVQRPTPTHGKFVRHAKVVKSSGAQILVLDLAHPESEIPPVGNQRYATLCVAHHTIRFHPGVSTAEARSSHPEEWCTGCADTTRDRAHARVYGGQERKLA